MPREVSDDAIKNSTRGEEDGPSKYQHLNQAFNHLGTVRDYYWNRFRRHSYDGKGATVRLYIHQPEGLEGDANWNHDFNFMEITREGVNLDTIAHEFTHGFVGAASYLRIRGQSGSLHEALADIFASNIDGNWMQGEFYSGGPFRDMSNPKRFKMPVHVRDYDPSASTHRNSSLASYPYYLMVQQMGRASAEQIVYRAITKYLDRYAGFEGFRTASLKAAKDLYGVNDRRYKIVNDSFAKVGLNGTWKAPTK